MALSVESPIFAPSSYKAASSLYHDSVHPSHSLSSGGHKSLFDMANNTKSLPLVSPRAQSQPRRAFQRVNTSDYRGKVYAYPGSTTQEQFPLSPPPSASSSPTPHQDSSFSYFVLAWNRLRYFLNSSSNKNSLPVPATAYSKTQAFSRSLPSIPFQVPSNDSLKFGLLCGLWYTSSALFSNTGKSILRRCPYPVTLTFVQFGYVAGYCILFLLFREWRSGSARVGGIQRASRTALLNTSAMCFFQVAGHVFTSTAIQRVPVSTVHTIKALSPLFTVLSYAALFGVRYNNSTYISLLPLTLGVMFACSFDIQANVTGIVCALCSTAVFVSQNIFSKKLLPKEEGNSAISSPKPQTILYSNSTPTITKLDKVNLLLYSSGMSFLLMIPMWFYTDMKHMLSTPSVFLSYELIGLFFINGTVHFTQSLIAFTILARTSPVTYSIASLIKRVAVICLAIIWWGQSIHPTQAFGMILAFSGLFMYNSSKGDDVKKGEVKRQQQQQFPLGGAAGDRKSDLLMPSSIHDMNYIDGITPPPTRRASPSPSSDRQRPSPHSRTLS